MHHGRWFTGWWMGGELQVMNLGSVSWEVIHMTSRAIRGLVPNLSGDNRCISSLHLLFFPPSSLTHGESLIRNGHLNVWSWTRSQPDCTYVALWAYVWFHLPTYMPQRQRETRSHRSSLRSHPSGLYLTLEDGCGPSVLPLTLDGSKVPLLWLRVLEEWSDSLDTV